MTVRLRPPATVGGLGFRSVANQAASEACSNQPKTQVAIAETAQSLLGYRLVPSGNKCCSTPSMVFSSEPCERPICLHQSRSAQDCENCERHICLHQSYSADMSGMQVASPAFMDKAIPIATTKLPPSPTCCCSPRQPEGSAAPHSPTAPPSHTASPAPSPAFPPTPPTCTRPHSTTSAAPSCTAALP